MEWTVTRWPNRCGWNVETEHGTAEVRDLVRSLRVFVPVAPRQECTPFGKCVTVAQHKACEVPLGTAPVDAVAECLRAGVLRDDGCGEFRNLPFINVLTFERVEI